MKEEGPSGLYRGLGPVIARQAANSAIRFTVFDLLKKNSHGLYFVPKDKPLPFYADFLNGKILKDSLEPILCLHLVIYLLHKVPSQGL